MSFNNFSNNFGYGLGASMAPQAFGSPAFGSFGLPQTGGLSVPAFGGYGLNRMPQFGGFGAQFGGPSVGLSAPCAPCSAPTQFAQSAPIFFSNNSPMAPSCGPCGPPARIPGPAAFNFPNACGTAPFFGQAQIAFGAAPTFSAPALINAGPAPACGPVVTTQVKYKQIVQEHVTYRAVEEKFVTYQPIVQTRVKHVPQVHRTVKSVPYTVRNVEQAPMMHYPAAQIVAAPRTLAVGPTSMSFTAPGPMPMRPSFFSQNNNPTFASSAPFMPAQRFSSPLPERTLTSGSVYAASSPFIGGPSFAAASAPLALPTRTLGPNGSAFFAPPQQLTISRIHSASAAFVTGSATMLARPTITSTSAAFVNGSSPMLAGPTRTFNSGKWISS